MVNIDKHTPRVTVLLPVFNGESFIGDAIDSIMVQTFEDYEFIIIDDGSTDGSYDIASKYTDPRIQLIKKKNEGLGKTLNYGINLARGEFIARLDVDDLSDPSRLEKQVEYLGTHPDVAVVGTILKVIYSDSTSAIRKKPLSHKDCMAYIIKSNPLAHPSVMFRKKVIKDIGGYALSLDGSRGKRYGMDYNLWVRVVAAGHKIGNLPEALIVHRKHSHSISGSKKFLFLLKERIRIRYWAKEKLGIGIKAYFNIIGVALMTIYQYYFNNKLDKFFNRIVN